MTLARASLELLILDLMSPIRGVPQNRLDSLSEEDWSAFVTLVDRQRVAPMIHWALKEKSSLRLPDDVSEWLSAEYLRYTIIALETQRSLLFVDEALRAASIPYVALKGAYLAHHAYPAPGLRPVRDIDVIVPKGRALDAFQLLQAAGATLPGGDTSPGSMLELSHQLPPLLSPSRRQVIEVHTRLLHLDGLGHSVLDPSMDPRFWERSVEAEVHGRSIPFECPEFLLFHLICHSVYDHKFNNGPLILSDVAFLLNTAEIDFSFFWSLVDGMKRRKGVDLVFRMVEQYWGIAIPDEGRRNGVPAVSSGVLETAAKMMFHDLDKSKCARKIFDTDVSVKSRGASRIFFEKIFPKRAILGKPFPVDPESSRVFLYYPKYMKNILGSRLPRYILGTERRQVKDELDDIIKLKTWLDG